MKMNSGVKGKHRRIKRRSMFKEVMVQLSRNKLAMIGLVIFAAMLVVCLLAPLIAPFGFDDQDVSRKFISPNLTYLCGTDNLGRDIFSRLLYGGRISLMVGVLAAGFGAIIGTVLGAIAGYYGGKIDNVIMRIMDIMGSMPSMLLAITICAVLGNGITKALIAVGISEIPGYARIVRAPILQVKEKEYVEAAISIDASVPRIVFKHVLPNALSPLIVRVTMGVASAITTVASLSFLGLGVQPPTPEWGSMLSAGRAYILQYPYMITFPGICIAILVLSLNFLGDGLRDALDPRLKA